MVTPVASPKTITNERILYHNIVNFSTA